MVPANALSIFVRLPENRSAWRAVTRLVAAGAKGIETPLLFLHGPSGSGKSHLIDIATESLTEGNAGKTARVVAAFEFGRELLQPPLERRAAVREVLDCDLLAIENMQHLPPAAANDLARVIDRRQARRRAVLVTAICGPADLGLSARLTSRLAGGLVVELRPLSEESRRVLAAALCVQSGLQVTDDVIEWLARPPGGARPILGELTRIETLSRVLPPPLSLAVVLASLPATPEPTQLPLERIVALVAGRFRVEAKAMRGPSRLKNVVWPRQVAMYLARQTGLSFDEIGQYFGGRDHTTVMHSCAKVAQVAAGDERFAKELRDARALLPG